MFDGLTRACLVSSLVWLQSHQSTCVYGALAQCIVHLSGAKRFRLRGSELSGGSAV